MPSPTDVPDPSHPGALSPSGTPAAPAPEPSPHTPRALAVLAGLRSTDPRLCLSEGELHALAPDAARWLDRRASSDEICRTLTSGLPAHFTGRPFHLLRYRLRAYLPPRPNGSPPSARGTASAAPAPLRTCAGCDKVAFRSAEHTHCSTCRAAPPLTPVST
ncbi:hypothetical protein GCM10009716_24530 [Streptomyces sodiiphilus]|uniref:Uncharacterized protein n=1 Tax=Streptomyces sodiiphilus TaxID=226217 RepID=A0ABN2P7R2_9ACTN